MPIEWLTQPAEVNRIVNYLYLIVVTGISIVVVLYAIRSKNKNAIRLYLFAIPVWMGIEGLGLVTGWRTYSEPQWLVYLIVSIGEDPGWVCLAYLLSERLFGWFFKSRQEHARDAR